MQIVTCRISQLHDCSNCCIEVVASKILDNFTYYTMAFAQQNIFCLLCFLLRCTFLEESLFSCISHQISNNSPSTIEEFIHTSKAIFVPLQFFIWWSHEQNISTNCIGTIAVNHFLGGNNIAFRFRHNIAMLIKHHALAQKIRKWLIEIKHAHIAQNLREETRIQQM